VTAPATAVCEMCVITKREAEEVLLSRKQTHLCRTLGEKVDGVLEVG
jgi:hypothetical protein